MSTRKSGDDSPSAKVLEQRPGSYVQVASSRRKRAEDGERPGSDPAARPAILKEGFLDELPTSRVTLTEGEGTPSVPVDDLRLSRPGTLPRVRREVGPLGMDDVRAPVEQTKPEPRPRAANQVVKQRMQVVEINPPELSAPPEARSATDAALANVPVANDVRPASVAPRSRSVPPRSESTPPRGASEPPRGVLRSSDAPRALSRPSQRPDPFASTATLEGAHLHARPDSLAVRGATGLNAPPSSDPFAELGDFSDQEVTALVESAVLASSDEAETVQRQSLSLFDADAALYELRRNEMARASLSSVLDARPSLLPSPPPPREKLSLGWRVAIASLCLVIVAALAVALDGAVEPPSASRESVADVPAAAPTPSGLGSPAANPTPHSGASRAAPLPERTTPSAQVEPEATHPAKTVQRSLPAASRLPSRTSTPPSKAVHGARAAEPAIGRPAESISPPRVPTASDDRALPPNPYLD